LAFSKLLKKYKKWTRSETLEARFKSDVLNRPTSFTNLTLNGQFDEWTEILQAIRAARNPDTPNSLHEKEKFTSSMPHPTGVHRQRQSSDSIASKFGTAMQSASDVAFDAIFADLPIGEAGAKAVYWIHQEQLIELQVLLLQHLRLYLPKLVLDPSSSQSQSPVLTRKSSLSRTEGLGEKEWDCGVIVLDEVEEYARRQSRSTVSDSEDCAGKSFAKPTAIARWASADDEAIISMGQLHQPGKSGFAKVKKKHLGALLNVDRDFEPWKSSNHTKQTHGQPLTSSGDALSPDEARGLIKKHREIKALVSIFAKRTRFLGLSNSSSAGQWCVLDSQIAINKVSPEDLVGTEWATNLSRDAASFPYAVLEIREEGKIANSIIDLLDNSHLVERVRGFSLASHAIWQCWKPKTMSPPFWVRTHCK
jgi:hypothetical protein